MNEKVYTKPSECSPVQKISNRARPERVYDIRRSDIFTAWFKALTDIKAKARIETRIERASKGNFGDWSPEGGDVRAMCIDYGPGYRLYYTIRKKTIVFLLCGGIKKGQQKDIKKARELAKEI